MPVSKVLYEDLASDITTTHGGIASVKFITTHKDGGRTWYTVVS